MLKAEKEKKEKKEKAAVKKPQESKKAGKAAPKKTQKVSAAKTVSKREVKPKKEKALPVKKQPLKAKEEMSVRHAEKEGIITSLKQEIKAPPREELRPVEAVKAAAAELKELELNFPISVKDLAVKLQEKPSSLIKALMDMRIMVGINQNLDEESVDKACSKYGYSIKKAPGKEEAALLPHQVQDEKKDLLPRAPIVTFMGHVDHGKTSLLDAIRQSKVVDSEHGGITQHIGAYRVKSANGMITFLDTPGHEAFTAMRARGAKATDVVVLVVAADDGIMPQTEEAIDHARAAGVPIIVALNKIDKPNINLERIKKQLSQKELTPEDWGGKTITVLVSAKTGQGIDDLLEMILLESQLLELKANPQRLARGVVLEAKMTKGKGPLATLLVQNGTLRLNDNIIIGNYYAKVRAMYDDRGSAVSEAGPAAPVEVVGISGVPLAGEQFYVLEDEKEAKNIASLRAEKQRQQQIKTVKRISLEDLHSQIAEGKIKELKLIVKADVQGSIEAIKETINKLSIQEIKLDIIHAGVGNINNSDVVLAEASNALILGFNVTVDERAKDEIAKEGIDVRIYNIIYELANDIKQALEGMLEPKIKKILIGRAEIRKVFRLSRSGIIAGCFVTKGKIVRSNIITLTRNGETVFEGKLSSLKRFKDDVRDVAEGYECGMSLAGFDEVMEGDLIEAYDIEKIARKL